jgi:hypothetical protein
MSFSQIINGVKVCLCLESCLIVNLSGIICSLFGGKGMSKKYAHSQPSNKGDSTSHRPPQPSHTARMNDVSTASHENAAAVATADAPAYDQQLTELKISIDVEFT